MISLLFAAVVAAPAKMPSDEAVAKFQERKVSVAVGKEPEQEYAYRLMEPAKIEPGKQYPVVLFMHGAGERGDDNKHQLLYLPELLASDENRERYPCFVIAPQCPTNKWWVVRQDMPAQLEIAEKALDDVLANFPVDRQRIYLTGISMGGFASWALAIRHPDLFAAVVPICGGGDVKQAERIAKVPIWAVHGDRDPLVPVSMTRRMIEALQKAGGDPKYSELPGVGHDSWTQAYNDPEGVVPWMFQQVSNKASAGN